MRGRVPLSNSQSHKRQHSGLCDWGERALKHDEYKSQSHIPNVRKLKTPIPRQGNYQHIRNCQLLLKSCF